EEEDEEDFCALSERWEYQKSVRRWSRKDLQPPCSPSAQPASGRLEEDAETTDNNNHNNNNNYHQQQHHQEKHESEVSQRAASHDSLLADQDDSAHTDGADQPDGVDILRDPSQNEDDEQPSECQTSSSSSASSTLSPRLRRAASERIKTAKSIWRKMEGGLKSRKSRRHQVGHASHRNGPVAALEISGPVLADQAGDMQARLERLQCVDIRQGGGRAGKTPQPDTLASRLAPAVQPEPVSAKPGVKSKPAANASSTTPPSSHSDSKLNQPASRSHEYYSAQSQLQQNLRQAQQKNSSSDGLGNLMEIFLLPQDHRPGRFPTALQNGYIEKDPLLSPASAPDKLGGNLISYPGGNQAGGKSLGQGSGNVNVNRASVYDNFGLPSSKPADTRILNSQFPAISESSKDSSPAPRGDRAMSADHAAESSSERLTAPKDRSASLDANSNPGLHGPQSSHTADSASDDPEALMAELSHDDSLDTIPAVSRERRDSGVGHSLTRAPSDRRRKKIRWHSFQRSHRPDVTCRAQQVNALTVGQLVRLQKLALLKLTGIMEKCLPVNKSGWNWMMPRFMKRHKTPDFSERTVFGVPLSVMVQRTGQPLPQSVLYAMRYLRRTSQASIGIFRKSGVKSKIQQLRDHLEAHPADTTDFEGLNTYNVADMLKTFFRDLPECLLTSKMSETFRSIYTHVPAPQRLEAMQAAILLLPDENREVLQSILLFLSDISSHSEDHQMNASNLAVCFTPTVFQLGRSVPGSPASPKRGRKHGGSSNPPGTPDPREILEQKAAHECLHMLITECKTLFTVPAHLFRQLQVISLAHEEPGPLHDLGTSTEEVRAFGQERIQLVLKEAHDKKSHWHFMHGLGDVEVYNRKPMDDYPLKEWKLIVDIEAPPIEVLRRIMHERHAWDEDLLSWSVVERLDPHSDIFQYALNTMAPHPSRHYCVLRYWRSDLTKGSCALVTMSVEHADVGSVQGVWAIDLGSYFLMEPCGAGRSRLTYITRVDTRGRTPEWYSKMYGHIQANFLERLKDSFKQDTSGPETKV
ncbi:hypothetical protein EGW08_006681, partial [Elysia chlorotica]